jgi:hypothetical protein
MHIFAARFYFYTGMEATLLRLNRHWEGQKYASLHERDLVGKLKNQVGGRNISGKRNTTLFHAIPSGTQCKAKETIRKFVIARHEAIRVAMVSLDCWLTCKILCLE